MLRYSPISHKSAELIEHEHGAKEQKQGQAQAQAGTNLISNVLKYVPQICICYMCLSWVAPLPAASQVAFPASRNIRN